MCAPAVVGIVSGVVSAAAAAAGTGAQIAAQRRSAAFQAAVQRNNARLAEFQQEDATQQAVHEEARVLQQGRRVAAAQTAVFGASGIDSTTGTAADTMAASAATAAQDAASIRANAARAAWRMDIEVDSRRAQAREIKRAGVLGSIGSGLSGIGAVSSGISSAVSSYRRSKL